MQDLTHRIYSGVLIHPPVDEISPIIRKYVANVMRLGLMSVFLVTTIHEKGDD